MINEIHSLKKIFGVQPCPKCGSHKTDGGNTWSNVDREFTCECGHKFEVKANKENFISIKD